MIGATQNMCVESGQLHGWEWLLPVAFGVLFFGFLIVAVIYVRGEMRN